MINDQIFNIRPDRLCDRPWEAYKDSEISSLLGYFLFQKSKSDRIKDVYEEFLYRNPESMRRKLESQLPKYEKFNADSNRTRMDIMRKQIENDRFAADQNGRRLHYYFMTERVPSGDPLFVVNLNQPVEISYEKDRQTFKKCFLWMLGHTNNDWPVEFLEFHFKNSFSGNFDTYRFFLLDCIKEKINEQEIIREWIEMKNIRGLEENDFTNYYGINITNGLTKGKLFKEVKKAFPQTFTTNRIDGFKGFVRKNAPGLWPDKEKLLSTNSCKGIIDLVRLKYK